MSEAVSGVVLAAHLDVTPSTIANLAAKGHVVRVGRGKYDLQASTRAYIGHLRESAAGRLGTNEELRAEKIRLTAAQADRAEMERDAEAEVMVNVKEFETRWANEMVVIRQGLLGLAAKIAEANPHFTRHEILSIDSTIRAMMERVADDAETHLDANATKDERSGRLTRRSRRR